MHRIWAEPNFALSGVPNSVNKTAGEKFSELKQLWLQLKDAGDLKQEHYEAFLRIADRKPQFAHPQ